MGKVFLKQPREYRLAEVAKKRQEIMDDERGKGIFSTWCVLPEEEGYDGWRPMGDIAFTISLSRKHDDVYYLYRLKNYHDHALSIAWDTAEEELENEMPELPVKVRENFFKKILTPETYEWHKVFETWKNKVEKRAAEIARKGIEIRPFFHLYKDSSAGIEVVGSVDVEEFTAAGTIEAINKFLDLGEIEWEGEPVIHFVSEDYLNPVYTG